MSNILNQIDRIKDNIGNAYYALEEMGAIMPTDETSANLASTVQSLGGKYVKAEEKGVANGVATLDSNGKVPSSQLPSYVDDVIEGTLSSKPNVFNGTNGLAVPQEAGKIYVDTTTNKSYRWGGTTYVEITSSLALGETSSTAYAGDKGKVAYDHSQKTSGNPHGVTKSDVGLGNVPNVATNDQTPTFSQASTLANIASGEKVSTIFGKIMKAIADFISHLANKSNPHGVTKAQVGLGSVENKSSATIRGELTKDNVTTALGYTPPTTNTTYSGAGSSLGLVKSGGDVTIADGVITVNDDSHNHTIANVDGLQSALDSKAPTHSHPYLEKTTYEKSAELACSSNGKVCLGKFGAYDTNITIELNCTTSTSYHATIVIYTQNIYANNSGGTIGCHVYDDANNAITPLITVFRPNTGSTDRKVEVYADLPGWSKNLVHVQGVAIADGGMTDVLTSVSSIPTAITGKTKVTPENILTKNLKYTLPAASGSTLGGIKASLTEANTLIITTS